MIVIDAKDMIVGRIATFAAKKALLGNTINIVNCEKAIITGKKKFLVDEFQRKYRMGTFKGPFLPKKSDRFVKRMIRGMLPYKQEKGKRAFQNIKCYVDCPKELEGQEAIKLENASVSKVKNLDYLTVGEICTKL